MALRIHHLLLLIVCSNLVLQHASLASPLQSDQQLGSEDDNHVARKRPHTQIFHPSSGLCVLRKHLTDPLNLGPCSESDSWYYTPQKFLTVKGTYYCMQAVESGKPVKLSIICEPSNSQWTMTSNSEKTHLATKLIDGTEVCLDIDAENTLVSNPCEAENVATGSQWFKLVTEYYGVKSAKA